MTRNRVQKLLKICDTIRHKMTDKYVAHSNEFEENYFKII